MAAPLSRYKETHFDARFPPESLAPTNVATEPVVTMKLAIAVIIASLAAICAAVPVEGELWRMPCWRTTSNRGPLQLLEVIYDPFEATLL